METVVWVRGECMNGWKDFVTDDKMSMMNTGVGDQLVWQVIQWNSGSSSKSMTTGKSLLMKLLQHSTWVMALRTVLSIMTSGYRKVYSRWVPRQLSDDHKCAWQTICQEHLDHHAREGDAFLHRKVTGDESWVYHYEPESKRQSMQWKHPSSLANRNSRHKLPLGKSCWPSFGMSLALYWCIFRKRVKL